MLIDQKIQKSTHSIQEILSQINESFQNENCKQLESSIRLARKSIDTLSENKFHLQRCIDEAQDSIDLVESCISNLEIAIRHLLEIMPLHY